MQQQASVSRLSVHLCLNYSSVLNYFHSNKGDLVVDRKLHCKRQAGVEAVKSRKEIRCCIGAGQYGQGIINIPLV